MSLSSSESPKSVWQWAETGRLTGPCAASHGGSGRDGERRTWAQGRAGGCLPPRLAVLPRGYFREDEMQKGQAPEGLAVAAALIGAALDGDPDLQKAEVDRDRKAEVDCAQQLADGSEPTSGDATEFDGTLANEFHGLSPV